MSNITPQAAQIIHNLQLPGMANINNLDDIIYPWYQVAKIVQACLVVHGTLTERDNTKTPQWFFLYKAHHEESRSLLHLSYLTRNSLTIPSESYPITAEPIVGRFAEYTLHLPARAPNQTSQGYAHNLYGLAQQLEHAARSGHTSEIWRLFHSPPRQYSYSDPLEYVAFCGALGFRSLPKFVMGFDLHGPVLGTYRLGMGLQLDPTEMGHPVVQAVIEWGQEDEAEALADMQD